MFFCLCFCYCFTLRLARGVRSVCSKGSSGSSTLRRCPSLDSEIEKLKFKSKRCLIERLKLKFWFQLKDVSIIKWTNNMSCIVSRSKNSNWSLRLFHLNHFISFQYLMSSVSFVILGELHCVIVLYRTFQH
jgi:hypothetical protein